MPPRPPPRPSCSVAPRDYRCRGYWCRRWHCPAWSLACTIRPTCSPGLRSARWSPGPSGPSSAKETPVSEEAPAVGRPPANLATGIVKAVRPRQWVKNLLVFAAPLFAFGGDVHYDIREVLIKVSIAFVTFSMAASSIYLINDARDVEADREHPTKRFRPIAAGVVPESLAYGLAAVLGTASLVISWLVTPNLALVMG